MTQHTCLTVDDEESQSFAAFKRGATRRHCICCLKREVLKGILIIILCHLLSGATVAQLIAFGSEDHEQ